MVLDGKIIDSFELTRFAARPTTTAAAALVGGGRSSASTTTRPRGPLHTPEIIGDRLCDIAATPTSTTGTPTSPTATATTTSTTSIATTTATTATTATSGTLILVRSVSAAATVVNIIVGASGSGAVDTWRGGGRVAGDVQSGAVVAVAHMVTRAHLSG